MLSRTFLTAQWRDLVLFSFEAQPALFDAFLPRGVELDDWRGRTFFSLIGFRFLESRLLGIPIPYNNLGAPIEEAFIGAESRDRDRIPA